MLSREGRPSALLRTERPYQPNPYLRDAGSLRDHHTPPPGHRIVVGLVWAGSTGLHHGLTSAACRSEGQCYRSPSAESRWSACRRANAAGHRPCRDEPGSSPLFPGSSEDFADTAAALMQVEPSRLGRHLVAAPRRRSRPDRRLAFAAALAAGAGGVGCDEVPGTPSPKKTKKKKKTPKKKKKKKPQQNKILAQQETQTMGRADDGRTGT